MGRRSWKKIEQGRERKGRRRGKKLPEEKKVRKYEGERESLFNKLIKEQK